MPRPQPSTEMPYGGHYSPLLARLLRRRLGLGDDARVIAWHRYMGGPRDPVALMAEARPAGASRYVSGSILVAKRLAGDRAVVRVAIDSLAHQMRPHLAS